MHRETGMSGLNRYRRATSMRGARMSSQRSDSMDDRRQTAKDPFQVLIHAACQRKAQVCLDDLPDRPERLV